MTYGRLFKVEYRVKYMRTVLRRTIAIGAALLSFDNCIAADRLRASVDEIRFEATLPTDGQLGYPLPLFASWSTGEFNGGFGPLRQLALIEDGHYLLPWFFLPAPDQRFNLIYYKKAIERAAELKLPISFISTQWESLLTTDPRYFALPLVNNPNVITVKGEVLREVSPFGPVGPWETVGTQWTTNAIIRRVQEWYPDPPLVLFVSNNEHAKLNWTDAGNSKRFANRYGADADGETKRRAVGDGWIQRYRALRRGMRDALTAKAWRENARFIGYNAWGLAALGRWDGWPDYSLHVPGRLSPMPLAWDGASPSYYLETWDPMTDFTVWSPQIESMNWVFMKEEAFRLNPQFWFELSVWDGHESDPAIDKREYFKRLRQDYTPERYAGFVKFGMWLLRPRAIRDFRYMEEYHQFEAYVMALVEAVDKVHTDTVLRRFWRKGRLVENKEYQHPYQSAIPDEYKNVPRWFLLNTSLDKPRPWTLSTEIPAFALALVLGQAPEREWLVYAFSPLGDRKDVTVTLPGHGIIALDFSKSGNYFYVSEKDGRITQLSGAANHGVHGSHT